MNRQYIEMRTANPNDRIALRAVRLRGTLMGMSLRATLEQTFVNAEDRAIEAVYTFPISDGAAVCGFEILTSDRVLTGTIDESDKAIERYDKAIEAGHGAYMLEQNRPDVFTVRVGNLKAHQAATIKLSYVQPLEFVDRAIRVSFPTTIAPRYATATGADPLTAAVDGDALNPPHVLSIPYGLTMEVDIRLGRAVLAIMSPTHEIRATPLEEDDAQRVTFGDNIAAMDRDLVLSIALKRDPKPTVQAAVDPAGGAFLAVTFLPEFPGEDLTSPEPSETVFILDCSGSMGGESIEQARTALALCLRGLSEGDTFNICRFGSTFQTLFPEPTVYTQNTLDVALKYIEQTTANLGGTELFPALSSVFSVKPRADTIRQIILLTDGQVTNEPAVLNLARQHRQQNRIFSFGIGTACSSHLVKGLARATSGVAEFISGSESINDKVLWTFSRLTSPPVTDVQIDWHNSEIAQAPTAMPPLFDGDALTVFARCAGRLPKEVTLNCRTRQGPRRWSVPVPAPMLPDLQFPIPTMWAKQIIQEIEEAENISPGARKTESAAAEKLLALSREFGVLCSLTTFIAVEHRNAEERTAGTPPTRRIPVTLAKGWGGEAPFAGGPAYLVLGGFRDSKRNRSLDLKRRITSDDASLHDDIELGALEEETKPRSSATGASAQRRGIAKFFKRNAPVAPSKDPLISLLSSQSAAGYFAATSELESQLQTFFGNRRGQQLIDPNIIAFTKKTIADISKVENTVAVLVVLRLSFVDQEPLWGRAFQKALVYLAKQFGTSTVHVETWLRELAERLRKKS